MYQILHFQCTRRPWVQWDSTSNAFNHICNQNNLQFLCQTVTVKTLHIFHLLKLHIVAQQSIASSLSIEKDLFRCLVPFIPEIVPYVERPSMCSCVLHNSVTFIQMEHTNLWLARLNTQGQAMWIKELMMVYTIFWPYMENPVITSNGTAL